MVTGHVDSPKVLIQTAEKRGIFVCGYHYNGSALAPKGYLTGAEWNWGPMYKKFVDRLQGGQAHAAQLHGRPEGRGGEDVALRPGGLRRTTKAKIDAVKAQMTAGTFQMFRAR